MRKILKIKWPHVIKNEEIYKRTNQEKWSERIKKRRLRWVGHMMRLPEETPVSGSLKEALIHAKRPKG